MLAITALMIPLIREIVLIKTALVAIEMSNIVSISVVFGKFSKTIMLIKSYVRFSARI